MQNRNLTLVIPYLFPPTIEAALQQQSPILNSILTRATQQAHPPKSFAATLGHLFGYTHEPSLPIAAVEAHAAGLPATEGWWLRLDPIHIQVDHKGVYLLGNAGNTLSEHEAKQLGDEMNELLALEGMQLQATLSSNWYLQCKDAPEITSYPLPELIGKELSPYLPYGPKAKFWRKLLTELQMIVHGSRVNQQRQECGLPQLGGVWLWGEGKLPAAQPQAWQQIWSDNPLVSGLAKLHGVNLAELPSSFDDCRTVIDQPGNYLLILDGLVFAQNDQGWTEILQVWEYAYFAPIAQALRTKQIQEITIYPCNGSAYYWKRNSLWGWLRRN